MDSDDWNQRYASNEFLWTVDPNQFLVAEIANLKVGRVLDLGTGEGRNAVWLAEHGWKVTAVDFSEVGLEKAKQLAKARNVDVNWMLADVIRYQPRRAQYDLVLMCYLQLPASERSLVIAHARCAIASRGTFLYIGHDLSNLEHGHGGPQDAAVLCTPQDIVSELPGFRILKAEVVQRPVSRDPGHGGAADAVALDTLVRACRPNGQHP